MKTKDKIIDEALMRIKSDDGTNEIGDYMSDALDEFAKQEAVQFARYVLKSVWGINRGLSGSPFVSDDDIYLNFIENKNK